MGTLRISVVHPCFSHCCQFSYGGSRSMLYWQKPVMTNVIIFFVCVSQNALSSCYKSQPGCPRFLSLWKGETYFINKFKVCEFVESFCKATWLNVKRASFRICKSLYKYVHTIHRVVSKLDSEDYKTNLSKRLSKQPQLTQQYHLQDVFQQPWQLAWFIFFSSHL